MGGIDNANIDPALYLDYSVGIAADVYRWILSDDGDYYTLAAVDEDGEPLTAEESAINTELLNATGMLLGRGGYSTANPALYWRVRSGTADQHTSFSVGYNICLAARSLGLDADYHLVWDMTSTGTFIDWINEICS